MSPVTTFDEMARTANAVQRSPHKAGTAKINAELQTIERERIELLAGEAFVEMRLYPHPRRHMTFDPETVKITSKGGAEPSARPRTSLVAQCSLPCTASDCANHVLVMCPAA